MHLKSCSSLCMLNQIGLGSRYYQLFELNPVTVCNILLECRNQAFMGSRHLLEVVVGLLDTLVLMLVAIGNYMMY